MNTANSKQQQNYHILVIDDEEKVAKFITEMLKNKGYAVTTLNSSKQAMEYFNSHADTIDLVITDQTMPDITGAELSKQMLQRGPNLPIFLITGFSEEVNSEKAAELGIKEYITKPLRLAELVEKLKIYLPDDLHHQSA
ncbi:MAG: response regulator [Candidatus Heimdallarchaeota archaeon]|nr:response regulator [Candidatus Heimdallarchaeota archaeon]